MTGFPALLVQIAFTSVYNDTTPVWVDVTNYTISVSTTRGRPSELSLCDPGTLTLVLNNSDGRFDPDNTALYAGNIRPNKRVRVGATVNGTYYPMFTGWVDSFTRTWPEGSDFSTTTVTATDRFKLMARQTDPTINSRPDEAADVRITALLQHFGIGVNDRSINAGSYTARTVATHDYDGENLLQTVQDIALADGGMFFADGYGVLTYQTYAYRTSASRATTSQARFGNDATSIPVESDLDPRVDDTLMMNKVYVADANGEMQKAEDAALQLTDGLLEYDIGSTLLLTADATARASALLALRKNPTPRYDSVTVDVLTTDTAANQEKVLARELSDRITLAVIPPGKAAGKARTQFIEGISHDIEVQGDGSWRTTFSLSSTGAAAVSIP